MIPLVQSSNAIGILPVFLLRFCGLAILRMNLIGQTWAKQDRPPRSRYMERARFSQ